MGAGWSYPQGIDGLNLRDNEIAKKPTAESFRKLSHFLRGANATYRLSSLRFSEELVSAYFLGYSPQDLLELYESFEGEPWPDDDPVAESIGEENLSEFYGQPQYQGRYYDYFRDCLTEEPGWEEVVRHHLKQLCPRLAADNWAPLVHLAAAVEIGGSGTVLAMEALAMACVGKYEPCSPPDIQFNHEELVLLVKRASKKRSAKALVVAQALCEIVLSSSEHIFAQPQAEMLLRGVSAFVDNFPDGEPEPPDTLAEKRARIFAKLFVN